MKYIQPIEKTKFMASKKTSSNSVAPPPPPSSQTLPKPGLEAGLKIKLNRVSGWVGKAEIRQPGKYKLNKTFCHLVLGLQFFSPQEHPLSELSYNIKILSQFLSPMLRLLSKLTALMQNTVREKMCVENLGTNSYFFNTRSYYEYCGLDLCKSYLLCYGQFIWFRAH